MKKIKMSAVFIATFLFNRVAFSTQENAVVGEFLVKAKSTELLYRALGDTNLLSSEYFLTGNPIGGLNADGSGFFKLTLSLETIQNTGFKNDVLETLKNSSGIEYIEPNYIYKIQVEDKNYQMQTLQNATPPIVDPKLETPAARSGSRDPLKEFMWAVEKTSAEKAWEISKGNKNVIVANVDTGIDYNHEDISASLWKNPKEIPGNRIDDDKNGFIDDIIGWDFIDKDALPFDRGGHGTHTAGTVAAVMDNGKGLVGFAPNVKIMSLLFLNGKTGSGTLEGAVSAWKYAIQNGATIINNSWGGPEASNALKDIMLQSAQKGIIFITAAGNGKSNNDLKPMYPAAYSTTNNIAVAATTKTDAFSIFSNFGTRTTHIAAPGSLVYSTWPSWKGFKYAYLDGTSMAAPHVTAAAALVRSVLPNATPQEVRNLMMQSADKIPELSSKVASGGRLNYFSLLKMSEGKMHY
jgi:subtilisin family serine protease